MYQSMCMSTHLSSVLCALLLHACLMLQLWMRLCDLCAKHPQAVSHGTLKVDAIVRSGLTRFTDEVGRLWCKLADYYIRLGQVCLLIC
jgi:hypothetical protein